MRESADIRVTRARATPLVSGVGEIAVGAGSPAGDGRLGSEGAIFIQAPMATDGQLTVAVTSAPSINAATGIQRLNGLDPADRLYPVYGDNSVRQEFALSSQRVYARLDLGQAALTYGDLRGDVPTPGSSGLLDVSRMMTGAEFEVRGGTADSFRLQVAQPETSFAREVFQAGSAGVIRLSNVPMVAGSEVLTLETRDRRRPDVVLDRRTLTRSVDYTVSPASGSIFFLRPLMLFADGLQVVNVVASYEYVGQGLRSSLVVARAGAAVRGTPIRVRGTLSRQSLGEGGALTFGGVGADTALPGRGRLQVELPVVLSQTAAGTTASSSAIRIDTTQPFAGRGTLHARYSRTGVGFSNPYSAVVLPGSATADGEFRLTPFSGTLFTVQAIDERLASTAGETIRQSLGSAWTQQVFSALRTSLRLDERRLRQLGSSVLPSRMLTGDLEWTPTGRVHTSVHHEENLRRSEDPTFPTQTRVSGRVGLTRETALVATQRWSASPIVPLAGAVPAGLMLSSSTRDTSIGLESRVGNQTMLTSRYQVEGGLNGLDSFAVIGAVTRLPLSTRWAVDAGVDRAEHMSGGGRSYTNTTTGLAFTPGAWVATAHLQQRTGELSRRLVTAGLAGQIRPGLTMLSSYRYGEPVWTGEPSVVDATAAVALRPVRSDRLAVLASWSHGNLISPTQMTSGDPLQRRTRLSADGYIRPFRRMEVFGRSAWVLTRSAETGILTGSQLLQGRAQVRVMKWVDVATELRTVRTAASGRVGAAGEAGVWVSPTLRVGVGYAQGPWSGTALRAAHDRQGGAYVVFSSTLPSLFTLFSPTR